MNRFTGFLVIFSAVFLLTYMTGCTAPIKDVPLPKDDWREDALTKEVTIQEANLLTENPKKYHKAEFAFALPEFEGNPFDPNEIEVFGVFTGPNGEMLTMPGFWYVGLMGKNPGWRIRFSPTAPGEWTYVLKAATPGGPADMVAGSFEAADSDRPGFVRIDPVSLRRFQFDNGDPYVAIGQNVCWTTGSMGATRDYDIWYRNMAEHGANFSRVWMAPWGFAIEWKDTGLGNYSARMGRALMLDSVMNLAETYNMYTMLVLLNHGQFSTRVNPEWHDNPFNEVNGGFLRSPETFFTDARAKALFQQRLRYIVARWGYSTHIMSWELWNEVNLTDRFNRNRVGEWHTEMAAYLRSIDPYNRLISTSGHTAHSPVHFEGMDFVNLHGYEMRNFPQAIAEFQRDAMEKVPDQPILFSEMGIAHDGFATRRDDPDGIHVHQGLWAGIMSGGAGTGMTWWWDSYIHPQRLYHLFEPISMYVQYIPWKNPDLALLDAKDADLSDVRVEFMGYRTQNGAYIWFYDRGYTHRNKTVRLIESARIELPMPAGNYWVQWFDPYGKGITLEEELETAGNVLIIDMPSWERDIAVIIERR